VIVHDDEVRSRVWHDTGRVTGQVTRHDTCQ
jgi:hypothetical protein